MKRPIVACVLFLVIVPALPACRGAKIRESEDRIDKLENRVTALEAKIEMMQKK